MSRSSRAVVILGSTKTWLVWRRGSRRRPLHGQSENTLRTLRREHEQVSKVAKEVPGLKRQNETLGQQRVQAAHERDQFRVEVERYAAELSAERQARHVEIEEQNRCEVRLKRVRNC